MSAASDQNSGATSTQNPAPHGYWQDARVLWVDGAMAAEFLQGYLTSDTLKLVPGTAQPTALCTVKGRVLANGWAVLNDQSIALILHASLFDAAHQFLTPYAMFSKCSLRAAPGYVEVNFSAADRAATDSVTADNAAADIELTEGLTCSLLDTEPDLPPDSAENVSDTVSAYLIAQDLAFVSAAVSETFLPQMLGLDTSGAVDFDKGCYLGQEIVARAQFRGEVKRRLQPFTWQDTQPEVGSTNAARDTVINVASNGHGLQVAKVK